MIAATNIDLEEAVRLGRFRQDLFYPPQCRARRSCKPLRERPGDILPLARYFLDLYGRQHERTGLAIGDAATRALLA